MLKMTHSQQIIKVMAAAQKLLDRQARQRITNYLQAELNQAGGFNDRSGNPDLYYSLFGLGAAYTLGIELPWHKISAWLNKHEPQNLGLIELSSLVKCLAIVKLALNDRQILNSKMVETLIQSLEKFRTKNGGYSYDGKGTGLPYAAFLAMNIFQDLERKIYDTQGLKKALQSFKHSDGRFANPDSKSAGLLLSTVAGLLTLKQLEGQADQTSLEWLKKQYQSNGGFKADSLTSLPDMLSTAVALFALKVCQVDMTPYKSRSKQFVTDHWLDDGSFCATLLDDSADCEYTYYGLLALGALA
jgi:prenyltransferase beta subunit